MGFFDIFKRQNKEETNKIVHIVEKNISVIKSDYEENLSVLLEQLPTTYELDETDLVEITDSRILARIESLVPSLSTTGVTVGNVIKNLKTQVGEKLYRVVLKNGRSCDLVNSRTIQGAKRAFTKVGNRIRENANLVPVEKAVDKGVIVTNAGAAVMGVASMVVGQYYMHRVDTQLTLISDHISKVIDYLDIQYKSQVASLMESVYNISKFQISSIENDELRKRELDNLQLLRSKCQELLNQSETMLETIVNKNCSTYDNYEKNVKEIEKWIQYQIILVNLLYQINILDFTFHLGIKSKEQCFGSFALHKDKMELIHARLLIWHNTQCEILKIELEESRRKHIGFLSLFEKPISWINNAWNYQSVDNQMVRMIKGQTAEMASIIYTDDNLFKEDVEIVIKNGKYYYLPAKNS